MAALGYLAVGAHEVALREEFAGAHAQLAADNLFVKAVVTVDDHVVDTCLGAFRYSHLEVDRVADDVALDGLEVIEEIAAVHVVVGDGVFVLIDALFKQLLVVDVPLFYSENLVEGRRGIERIAHPCYIVDIISFAFVDTDVDVDILVIVGHNRVADDTGVAVAFLVIFLDDAVEVVAVVALDEFFLLEEVEQLAFLVGLLHGALNGVVAHDLVALDIDFVDFDLVVAVDVDVDDHLVGMAEVFVLLNLHGSVAEAFLIVVFLDDLLRAVDDVGRDVVALHELEALVEVFYLPFSGAVVVYLADTRLLAQMDRQPCLVAGGLVDGYRHFRE